MMNKRQQYEAESHSESGDYEDDMPRRMAILERDARFEHRDFAYERAELLNTRPRAIELGRTPDEIAEEDASWESRKGYWHYRWDFLALTDLPDFDVLAAWLQTLRWDDPRIWDGMPDA